ncbi:flagellin [Ponticaulis sp.]|uniref:flagellin n=1 Tax=Ponticaulis sp. TaxID=2020902 RepID=UPI0025CCF208|nr:flagellin [Ponticaulis sp.]|tara:strand:+ start:14241 stop:15116 length:876 start_codon:yes stop_codon:yes gene_type:complete
MGSTAHKDQKGEADAMPFSVNTNSSALSTAQSLKRSDRDLQAIESRINTGRKINGAKDDGAIFALAQSLRADLSGFGVVQESMDLAIAVGEVSLAAVESISDLIIDMKEKALAAADPSLDDRSRAILNQDFIRLRDQVDKVVGNAAFNDLNLLNATTPALQPATDVKGGRNVDVPPYDIRLGGSDTDLIPSMVIDPLQDAKDSLTRLESALEQHTNIANVYGGRLRTLQTTREFAVKTSDVLQKNLGTLVDADLGREGARLQAAQTQQQLQVQSMSIANQLPTFALKLFGQ